MGARVSPSRSKAPLSRVPPLRPACRRQPSGLASCGRCSPFRSDSAPSDAPAPPRRAAGSRRNIRRGDGRAVLHSAGRKPRHGDRSGREAVRTPLHILLHGVGGAAAAARRVPIPAAAAGVHGAQKHKAGGYVTLPAAREIVTTPFPSAGAASPKRLSEIPAARPETAPPRTGSSCLCQTVR